MTPDTDAQDRGVALRRTSLYEMHRELGARMVPFAGFEMPVQYPAGIINEHEHTRNQASLFDVGHMGQIRLSGDDAARALETLTPADVVGLPVGRQRYGLFTDAGAGILDDFMVVREPGSLLLIVNAARTEHDLALLDERIGSICAVDLLRDQALLALSGPAAAAAIAGLSADATSLRFMHAIATTVAGIECLLMRSGYTGEDGFEISVPAAAAERLARSLLDRAEVRPAGLGARDSLRLEAGLCLYGQDIDASTTPVQAGLAWTVGRARRPGGDRAGGFPGAEQVFAEIERGASPVRVGLLPDGRAPVRHGARLCDNTGRDCGWVSSGGYSPTLMKPIAMAYLETGYAQRGTVVQASVRGQRRDCRVVDLPFVEHRYFTGESK
jgi:glycine cleavage system T protein (aminomethyltransferase)